MKLVISVSAILVLCLVTPKGGRAQCQFIYSPNYSVYTTESTDGTNIFTAVLTDGNSSMTVSGSCPDGVRNQMMNAINSATHTPSSYNKISTAGGWGSGSSGCVGCYISYQNNQSFAATPGTEYEFDWTGSVNCSVGGAILTLSGIDFLSIHRTMYKYVSVDSVKHICYYNVNCITSHHICGADTTTTEGPPCGFYASTVWLKVRVGNHSSCIPMGEVDRSTWLACF